MASKRERLARIDFSARYSAAPSGVVDEVEAAVIGEIWGANGYTTVAEADRLADQLDLGPDKHLLDLGSGRGWPGLYLAKRTGCLVTLTDLPYEGLRIALARGDDEKVGVAGAVVASGKQLPFAPGSFDAIAHTDVLC